MKLALVCAVVVLSACAENHVVAGRSEMAETIDRSSAHVVVKRNADDGSRAGGVVAYFLDEEEPVAQAAAEQFCDGPVRVRSQELAPNGQIDTTTSAVLLRDTAFAAESSRARRAWRMSFDCDRAASADAVAAYRAKFAKPLVVRRGLGDAVLGHLGL